MGVKKKSIVKTAPVSAKRAAKSAPKKVASKKVITPKKSPAKKDKPESKPVNDTPKKETKPKRGPKKEPKKKPAANVNDVEKKEIVEATPANNVEVKESRKRAATKIENDLPAKKPAKEKPAPKKPKGRPPKSNSVATPKKKEEKPVESAPESTNDVEKKQSKPKRKSAVKGKKSVGPKTPKKSTKGRKLGSSSKAKTKGTGAKTPKKVSAAKTKIVIMLPVVTLKPLNPEVIKRAQSRITRKRSLSLKKTRVAKLSEQSQLFKSNRSSKPSRNRNQRYLKTSNRTSPTNKLQKQNQPLKSIRQLLKSSASQIKSLKSQKLNAPKTQKQSQLSKQLPNERKTQETLQFLQTSLEPPLSEKGRVSIKIHEPNVSETIHKSGYEDYVEENCPVNKKYQSYMKKIEQITPDEIIKFMKDNKNDYEKLKNIKHKTSSRQADMKNLFKCNPFNSEQQLAMYLTLREMFNVPPKQFKECRNFFTVIMPEISCQLFAETFNIKVTAAPRLIRKLYPKPVSPF